ncbi:MAG: hypothetical protein HC908_15945 [Calothrix sp. SM1_7_51]|nr:hypothetical protein [Calothrix sp. SM1_7_51]
MGVKVVSNKVHIINMPEQIKEKQLSQNNWTEPSQGSLASIILEIEKIPQEHWSNLLQLIRLFGKSVINEKPPVNATSKLISELTNLYPTVKAARFCGYYLLTTTINSTF